MIQVCSFCGVDANDSWSMVASETVAICWKCSIEAMRIMRDYTAGELEYRSWLAGAAVREGTNE